MTSVWEAVRAGVSHPDLDVRYPFVPLDAPGMPAPAAHSVFVAEALRLGEPPPEIAGSGDTRRVVWHGPIFHYLLRRALYDETFTLTVVVRGQHHLVRLVPGHVFGVPVGEPGHCGPRPSRVMILGKHPGNEEVQAGRNFVGPTSTDLYDALAACGLEFSDIADWYVTNLVKWSPVDVNSDTLPRAWVADGLVLLAEELRLVRPEFILCLGADASKALLGSAYSVSAMVGRVEEYTFPVHRRGEPAQYHTAKVVTATHPAAVYRRRELYDEFEDQIRLFVRLVRGEPVSLRETAVRHLAVYTAEHLRAIIDEILADPDPWRRVIAVDAEWHGEYPTAPGAYLRTIQFSSRHGEGITVVLRHQGGSPAFYPSPEAAIVELRRLLTAHDGWVPRIGGHFFRADLPWLLAEGLDLRPYYAPAGTPERCRTEGGWDTSLMYHAVAETASFKLEDIAVRLTTAPRYDVAVQAARREYCRSQRIKESDLEGYGFMPDWILHPYAAYDADVTRRIAMRCMEPGGLLDKDRFGNSSWMAYWIAHRASLAFLEMEMTGILLDWERVDKLTATYMEAYDRLLAAFRRDIRWPDFNPKSAPQCAAFLFGDAFGQKRTAQGTVLLRPPEALTLNLSPIKTTGKRSKAWSDVVARGEASRYRPSTDKETLGILGHVHPLAMRLRDLKFIGHTLQSVLRPPERDAATDDWETEDGHGVYSGGLPSAVRADGRIHTHLYQTKETGRASSSRPPLQNLSSRREADYRRILGYRAEDGTAVGDYLDILGGPQYLYPLRSMLRASPGWVLVEADLVGAELAVAAWASGDPLMIEHVRRNALPETHPEYYDIHSNMAVTAFRLDCPPTKKGLKEAGKAQLRVAAKNVIFGANYGRSAAAIARQCREEGCNVDEQTCQQLLDAYFERYPYLKRYLDDNRRRSQDPGWLCNFFLRYRRFVASRDRAVIGEQERQAMNAPIQGAVADAISIALSNLLEYRAEHPELEFRILLQIHDAILVECPVECLAGVRQMLLTCMSSRVALWPRYTDGRPIPGAGPYHFGVDFKVSVNWGEALSPQQAEALGIDPTLL